MATIALYQGKINQMPSLIKAAKQSVESLKTELSSLQKKAAKVDAAVCDMSEVISSVETCTKTQENRIEALDSFQTKLDEYVNDAVRIDDKVAETVNENKENFYEKYNYLKPECEKGLWEKICEGLKAVGEWCKEHWAFISSLALVTFAAGLVLLGVGGLGALFAKITLSGALVGFVEWLFSGEGTIKALGISVLKGIVDSFKISIGGPISIIAGLIKLFKDPERALADAWMNWRLFSQAFSEKGIGVFFNLPNAIAQNSIATFWKMTAKGLDMAGYHLSAALLEKAASDNGTDYFLKDTGYAVDLCKNDAGIKNHILQEIREGNNVVITADGKVEGRFTYEIPVGNGDLGAALHRINIRITGEQANDGIHATVIIEDTFDFTEFVNPFEQGSVKNGILWFANDVAYFDDQAGILQHVNVRIQYDDVFSEDESQ